MFDSIESTLFPIVSKINECLSNYVLVFLLLGVGIWYTVKTRCVQVRCFKEGWNKVFGSLTLYLRNEMFIKWKPAILYWIFGDILVYGNFAGRNFIRMLLSKAEIEMPGHAWGTLQNMWIGFFAAMGVVNLLVAYLCSTDTWVNFKLFGLMGLTLVFTIGIGVFMTKHAVTRQN